MKNWIRNLYSALRNEKGESLVESVISIVLFTLYMLAVSTMIAVSLLIIKENIGAAEIMQTEVNAVVLDGAGGQADDVLTLTEASGAVSVSIDVKRTTDGIVAFSPEGK